MVVGGTHRVLDVLVDVRVRGASRQPMALGPTDHLGNGQDCQANPRLSITNVESVFPVHVSFAAFGVEDT